MPPMPPFLVFGPETKEPSEDNKMLSDVYRLPAPPAAAAVAAEDEEEEARCG